jgi:hypothetical protein
VKADDTTGSQSRGALSSARDPHLGHPWWSPFFMCAMRIPPGCPALASLRLWSAKCYFRAVIVHQIPKGELPHRRIRTSARLGCGVAELGPARLRLPNSEVGTTMDPHCGYLLPNSGVYRGPSVGLSIMTELPGEVNLHCKRDRGGTKKQTSRGLLCSRRRE